MRTTLDIDADILAAARSLARGHKRSIGKVLSELARRGLEPRAEQDQDHGIPIFRVSRGASPITPEMVRRAADD